MERRHKTEADVKRKTKKRKAAGAPEARLPLPKKTEKRHGDKKKYDREREKGRVRRELGLRAEH